VEEPPNHTTQDMDAYKIQSTPLVSDRIDAASSQSSDVINHEFGFLGVGQLVDYNSECLGFLGLESC